MDEAAALGGVARVLGDGLVLVTRASLTPAAALRLRCQETLGVLVGTLALSGESSDLEVFRTLCFHSTGLWGGAGPGRWAAATAAWAAARRIALGDGYGRIRGGDDKEGRAWQILPATSSNAREPSSLELSGIL